MALLALLLSLGSWQLRRGLDKQALMQSMDAAAQAQPERLSSSSPVPAADEELARHIELTGRFDPSRQLLLDNQSFDGRPGYHVWTLLQTGGSRLLVDRGWIPQPVDRARPPELAVDADLRTVSGLWRPLPRPALRMGGDACPADDWPRIAQYPRLTDLECLYGGAISDGVLLLDPDAADGYRRRWSVGAEIPPSRHYGYAAQWYALAVTLLVLFVRTNRKAKR
jgi:cytochrome oxidase assembly protein ShyY1